MFLLAAVLVAGTISMTIPSSFALPYVPDFKDPYTKDHKKKAADVNNQKVKCSNNIVNINGVDVNQIPDTNGISAAQVEDPQEQENSASSNRLFNDDAVNLEKNLANVCINFNHNDQITPTGEEPPSTDPDQDGIPSPNDNCPVNHNPTQIDSDADSIGDICDNCPFNANPDQMDNDGDGIGNVCDPEDNSQLVSTTETYTQLEQLKKLQVLKTKLSDK